MERQDDLSDQSPVSGMSLLKRFQHSDPNSNSNSQGSKVGNPSLLRKAINGNDAAQSSNLKHFTSRMNSMVAENSQQPKNAKSNKLSSLSQALQSFEESKHFGMSPIKIG